MRIIILCLLSVVLFRTTYASEPITLMPNQEHEAKFASSFSEQAWVCVNQLDVIQHALKIIPENHPLVAVDFLHVTYNATPWDSFFKATKTYDILVDEDDEDKDYKRYRDGFFIMSNNKATRSLIDECLTQKKDGTSPTDKHRNLFSSLVADHREKKKLTVLPLPWPIPVDWHQESLLSFSKDSLPKNLKYVSKEDVKTDTPLTTGSTLGEDEDGGIAVLNNLQEMPAPMVTKVEGQYDTVVPVFLPVSVATPFPATPPPRARATSALEPITPEAPPLPQQAAVDASEDIDWELMNLSEAEDYRN